MWDHSEAFWCISGWCDTLQLHTVRPSTSTVKKTPIEASVNATARNTKATSTQASYALPGLTFPPTPQRGLWGNFPSSRLPWLLVWTKQKLLQRCVILRALIKVRWRTVALYIFPIYSDILARQRVGSVTPETVNLQVREGSWKKEWIGFFPSFSLNTFDMFFRSHPHGVNIQCAGWPRDKDNM